MNPLLLNTYDNVGGAAIATYRLHRGLRSINVDSRLLVMRKEMDDPDVLAKKEAATQWCVYASDHAATYDGKPWRYLLIPHDEIASNITLSGLEDRFTAA